MQNGACLIHQFQLIKHRKLNRNVMNILNTPVHPVLILDDEIGRHERRHGDQLMRFICGQHRLSGGAMRGHLFPGTAAALGPRRRHAVSPAVQRRRMCKYQRRKKAEWGRCITQ